MRLTPIALSLVAISGSMAGMSHAAASRITQVTLYPGSATVERSMQVPAGAQQVTFTCLPAGLDAQALQVTGASGINVGDITVREQPRSASLGCPKAEQSRIETIEERIATLQAEAKGLEFGNSWLNRFEQPANAAQIGATVDALRRSGQQSALRQHQIDKELEALEAELQSVQGTENRNAQSSQASTVQITLSAPQGGSLNLRYLVTGPTWQPGYRATLNVEANRVKLERTAIVRQSTGEDWRDVPLLLSTGQPNAAANGPLPRPWRLTEAQPEPMMEAMQAAPAPMAPAPANRKRTLSRAASANAGLQDFTPEITEGGHATTFTLPQRMNIAANGTPVTLSLGEQQLDARVLVRTSPAQDPRTYLIASFTLPSEGVWPAGMVRLYRDGSYVGSSRLDASQVAETGLGFGLDERVQVRALPAQQTQSQKGLINSRNQRVVHNSWEIRNNHRTPIQLQVLDAAPVAEHTDIRVQSVYSPQPTTTSWREQPGSVMWEAPLAPQTAARFSAEHTLSWPADMRLREQR